MISGEGTVGRSKEGVSEGARTPGFAVQAARMSERKKIVSRKSNRFMSSISFWSMNTDHRVVYFATNFTNCVLVKSMLHGGRPRITTTNKRILSIELAIRVFAMQIRGR